MNGNRKGKRGERQACEALRAAFGCEARRGQQFAGGAESPDVKHSIEGLHFEVKRTEQLRLHEAMQQAIEECGGAVPVVLHKANFKPWLAIVRLDDLDELAKVIQTFKMAKAETVAGYVQPF